MFMETDTGDILEMGIGQALCGLGIKSFTITYDDIHNSNAFASEKMQKRTEKWFSEQLCTKLTPSETKAGSDTSNLAVKLSEIVHSECSGAKHDIGLRLAEEASDYFNKQLLLAKQNMYCKKNPY